MKIAFISDAIYPFIKGGSEKRIYDISKRLVDLGHDIHIFGMKWWTGEADIVFENINLHGICNPHILYKNNRRSIFQALKFSSKISLSSSFLSNSFDLIDCSQFPYLHFYGVYLHCLVKHIPFIYTCHEVWGINNYWDEYLGRLAPFGLINEHTIFRLAPNVITTSIKAKDDLFQSGVSGDKIRVVPIGIEYEEIQKVKPSLSYSFDIIFVGRLIRGKNVDLLLRAVKVLKDSGLNISLGIIGDGPEMPILRILSESLKISEHVTFFGFLDNYSDVISVIKSAKVFVLPSSQEGGPSIVVLEAYASHIPVIIIKHDNGVSEELVKHGITGLIVDNHTPCALANNIQYLLDNDKRRIQMGRNALTFSRNHSWNNVINQLLNVYRDVMTNE